MVSRPRSDGKREIILMAAVSVIAAEGVHGATTRKIAAKAGINLGTLHYHFESKEDVLASVVVHLAGLYMGNLERAFPEPEPLRQRIGNLMRFIWGEVRKAPQEQIALFDLLLYTLTEEGTKRIPKQRQSPYQRLYRRLLEESSDVPDGLDVEALANFLFNGFVGVLMQWLASDETARAESQLGLLVRAAEKMFF